MYKLIFMLLAAGAQVAAELVAISLNKAPQADAN
jgi:hypothetical protein